MVYERACQRFARSLEQFITVFRDAVVGLAATSERIEYAHFLLQRLLFIYNLQRLGFLGGGDRWYLHTWFGEFHHRQPNSFFQGFFQPLCYQGLGLPEPDRPQDFQQTYGPLPYLGSRLFQRHPLEQANIAVITVPDAPFEDFLGWLAEQTWCSLGQTSLHEGTVVLLAGALEYIATGFSERPIVSSLRSLDIAGDRTVDAYILKAINQHHGQHLQEVAALLKDMEDSLCLSLVKTILPSLTVLDPACGSGRLLLMALERIRRIYQVCYYHAQQSDHPDLKAWLKVLLPGGGTANWQITHTILIQHLYGVDIRPEAVSMTQFQLWLALVSTAETAADLRPLPDLDLTIITGNSLVGFIQVDEEGFDRIVPRSQHYKVESEIVLQGNLLQPLTASSYRDTLAEKQIRIEHYHAQTQLMGEVKGISPYVQHRFLRDRIQEAHQVAQTKLNQLLWATFSLKLGIVVRESDPSGHIHRRLLTLKDIEALHPVHWGFAFSSVLETQGGFAAVLTQAPRGILQPSAREFYRQHEAWFRQHQIEAVKFQRSHRRALQACPPLAKAWSIYAGRFSYLRRYFQRSEDFPMVTTAAFGKVSWAALFKQRCAALVSPDGIAPYFHTPLAPPG